MRAWRNIVFPVVILTSSTALASTELPGAGFPVSLAQEPSVTSASNASSFDTWAREIFAGTRADRADDEPFAVDETWFSGRSDLSPAKRNPFTWTFLLIAFAGLTAVFARKRSGGRGLISA